MHGPAGIVPTRGQVIAMRAAAPTENISTSSWLGNEGFEYWFPRPVQTPGEHPLIILGGGRETVEPSYEFGENDDSKVNPIAGRALRDFLPATFPAFFEKGRNPEMEWVRFSRVQVRKVLLMALHIDWYHGIYQEWRPIRT